MTPLPDEHRAHVSEAWPSAPSDGALRAPWMTAIEGLCGTARTKGIMPREVGAAYQWLAALRADLEHEPTAGDEAILGSLARLQLLELRLSRTIFGHGAVRRNGEVKPALTELRGVIRLKADLLRQLTFRDGAKPSATLETYLRDRALPSSAPIATSADAGVGPVVDRVAATEGASEVGS